VLRVRASVGPIQMTWREFKGVAMNTATLGPRRDLFDTIAGCEKFHVPAISLARSDLHRIGLRRARSSLASSGLTITTLSRVGAFTSSEARVRREAIDDARTGVDEAAEIGANCLVIIAGAPSPPDYSLPAARSRIAEGIHTVLPYAQQAGVRLTIEPLHPWFAASRSCINTVKEALLLSSQLGGGIGVTLDTYHVWWDPGLAGDLEHMPPGSICAFQIADFLADTIDPMSDRGIPGEGVIDLAELARSVLAAGYTDYVDVEVMSTRWWQADTDEIFSACLRGWAACGDSKRVRG